MPKPPTHPQKIKSFIYTKYYINSNIQYIDQTISNILESKPCHLVAQLKDLMIYDYPEEFLKRYYPRKESTDKIPKYMNYYKNYWMFFCKPVFADVNYNSIIQGNGERLAEVYYNNNYARKNRNEKKERKKDAQNCKIIFSETVKENIGKVSVHENNSNDSKDTIALNKSNFILMNKSNHKNNLFDDTESQSHSLLNIVQSFGWKIKSKNRISRTKLSNDTHHLLSLRADSKEETLLQTDRFTWKQTESKGKHQLPSVEANDNPNWQIKKNIKLFDKLKTTKVSVKPINILKQPANIVIDKGLNTNQGNNIPIKPTHVKNVLSTQIKPMKIIINQNQVITLTSRERKNDRWHRDLSRNQNGIYNSTPKNYHKSNYSIKSSLITPSSKQLNREVNKITFKLGNKSKLTTKWNKCVSRNNCKIYPFWSEDNKRGKTKIFCSYNNFENQQKWININRKRNIDQEAGNKANNRTGSSIMNINLMSNRDNISKINGVKIQLYDKGVSKQ